MSTDEIGAALRALTAENLIMRLGHGRYGVADPVVRELARERRRPLDSLGADGGGTRASLPGSRTGTMRRPPPPRATKRP